VKALLVVLWSTRTSAPVGPLAGAETQTLAPFGSGFHANKSVIWRFSGVETAREMCVSSALHNTSCSVQGLPEGGLQYIALEMVSIWEMNELF